MTTTTTETTRPTATPDCGQFDDVLIIRGLGVLVANPDGLWGDRETDPPLLLRITANGKDYAATVVEIADDEWVFTVRTPDGQLIPSDGAMTNQDSTLHSLVQVVLELAHGIHPFGTRERPRSWAPPYGHLKRPAPKPARRTIRDER